MNRKALMLLGAALAASALCFLLALGLSEGQRRRDMWRMSDQMRASDQQKVDSLAEARAKEAAEAVAKGLPGRLDFQVARLQELGRDAAWADLVVRADAKRKPSPAKAPDFKALAEAGKEAWPGGLTLIDAKGKPVAAWPEVKNDTRDFSSSPAFKALAAAGKDYLGVATLFDTVPDPATKKPTLLLVMALADPAAPDKMLGMLEARVPLEAAIAASGAKLADLNLGKNGSLLLVKGTGRVVFSYPRAERAFVEDLSLIDAQKKMLDAACKANQGAFPLTYDSRPGKAVWAQLWPVEARPARETQQFVLAFICFDDLKGASAAPEFGRPVFLNPLVLLLVVLGIGIPVGLLAWKLKPSMEPYAFVQEEARRAAAGELVVEPPEAGDPGAQVVLDGLKALSERVRQADERLGRLNEALGRQEEAANRNAAAAARELSEARAKLASGEVERDQAKAKAEQAERERTEAQVQLENTRAAVAATQKSLDLKNQQNSTLNAQVQDLVRQLEQQKTNARALEERATRRDLERVRLDAINTLSSELKATLTVIKSYISTILGTSGAISSAQQEFLGVVINKSARLERLINDLVDLSQIESGLKGLQLAPTSPANWLREILMQAQVQADNKKITLELASPANPADLPMDVGKMTQVMHTLLTQAIKVTSRGEKIQLLMTERDQAVEIRVIDPGMSLPPDRAGKVFTHFHGVDSPAGPEFIGTGLRFPIIKSIVEAHGGKLWIESQVGKGKTFVLALSKQGPSAPAPAPALAAVPRATPPLPPIEAPAAPKPMAPMAPLASLPPAAPAPLKAPEPAPVPANAPAPLPSLPPLAKAEPAQAPKPKLDAAEVAGFDAIFGEKKAAEPQPQAAKPKLDAAEVAGFDAIFGEKKAAEPLSQAAKPKAEGEAAPMPKTGKGPALPAGRAHAPKKGPLDAAPAGPSVKKPLAFSKDEEANLDAIFGGGLKGGALPPLPAPAAPTAPSTHTPLPPLPGLGGAEPAKSGAALAASLPPLPEAGDKSKISMQDLGDLDNLFGEAPMPKPGEETPAPKPTAPTTFTSLADLTSMIQGGAPKKDDIIE